MLLHDYKVVQAYIALFDLYIRNDKPNFITVNQWCDNIIKFYPDFTCVYATCMNALTALKKSEMISCYYENESCVLFTSKFENVPDFWDITKGRKKSKILCLPENCYHHQNIEDGAVFYAAHPTSTPLPLEDESSSETSDTNLKKIILQLISAIENISADVIDIKKTVESLKRDNSKTQKVENLVHALRDLNGGIDG